MDHAKQRRSETRRRRVLRVRKKVQGTAERPRLTVSKTNTHLYAQLIDDVKGLTLVGLGTLSKEHRGTPLAKKSREAARTIGKKLAEIARSKHNVSKVVFDRGRYKYHGLIAELAEGAREAGLQL